ncbi:MAG: hypothetical protein IID33_15485, partial [Planctomycetes bacterium]|nr:hypothetical protein [Planctomycetota bacterium]
MSRIASCCTATAAFLTVLTVVGCSDKSGSQTSQSWIDSSITEYHPLGWLGGRAHPATRTVLVANDDGAEIAVGGMVVTELDADGPLAQAGAARGDVLVRVGETWLPNKDDPSLDLIRAVEAEVSAMVRPIRLSVLRDGTVQQLSLAHEMKPMEVGLPAASKRLGEIAQAGLRNLAESQAEDGSFPAANEDVSQSVATCSVAGLAFIAGGASADDSPFAQALEQCRARVEKAISNKESELSAWSLSWAAMFLAECAGPLEIAGGAVFNIGQALPSFTPSGGKPVVMKMDSGTPGQAQHRGGMRTFSFKSEGSLPEGMDLEELQKNGQVQIIRMGPGGGMPGAAISGSAPTSEMADEPLWTVEQLQAIAGEESGQRIKPLLEAVRRLVALQEEPGGWDARDESLGYSQRTVTTNPALVA